MVGPPLELRELIPAAEVRRRIEEMGEAVARDHAGRSPVFIVIAEGARRLAEALIDEVGRRGIDPEVILLRVSRTRGTALLPVHIHDLQHLPIRDREVVIIDDIVDEGRTLEAVSRRVGEHLPRSVRIAVLIDKRTRRQVETRLDYVGFEVDGGWIVGFGMDLEEAYRDLDHIAVVEPQGAPPAGPAATSRS